MSANGRWDLNRRLKVNADAWVEVRLHKILLKSALDGGGRSTSPYHWTWACLRPGADVDNLQDTDTPLSCPSA